MAAMQPQDRRNDTAQPQQDRRSPERRSGSTDEPGTPRRRKTDELLRRYRQPLIGLGLAGMAFPLVQATSPQEDATTPQAASDEADPGAVAQLDAAQDTEDHLADRIAVSVEDQEREQQVESAVQKYNIARDLAEDIYDMARETNIAPKLAYGLVKTESTFNERAVSHVGARGLTQVMPRTAAWLVPGTKTQDLYDRQTNLRLGFTYLDQMIDKYKGDVRLALLAYNRGPGTVDKVLKRGGNPDNGYADKVLRG